MGEVIRTRAFSSITGSNDRTRFAINLLFQQRRALERNHSARCQVHILPRCRVPAPPGCLLPDSEFAKAADEKVVATGRELLINSRTDSTRPDDSGLETPRRDWREPARWSLVRVMDRKLPWLGVINKRGVWLLIRNLIAYKGGSVNDFQC